MAQKKSIDNKRSKKKISTELVVALIGFMGTLIVAFFGFLNKRTEILLPVSITQTFEAKYTPVSDFLTAVQTAHPTLIMDTPRDPSASVTPTFISTSNPITYDVNSIITFDSIEIESTNPDWFEVPPDDRDLIWNFGVTPAKRFWTYKWGIVTTPSFDITIINRTDAPILVTDIGIQLIGITDEKRGGGGGIPGSERVEITDAYIIQMPDFHSQYSAEKWDEQTNMEAVVSIHLTDPIYMQSLAPFRYILIFDQYRPNMPTDAIFRMWVQTSVGEATSSLIQLNTGP